VLNAVFLLAACSSSQVITTDVLVIGGGTGGTAAGLQSARYGTKTMIVEKTPWLGGMISAAGVSAIDGNHKLPSGIWNEFREKIYAVYGGAAAVETGWVSNTLFEPHVADSIFKAMAANEKNLSVLYHYRFEKLTKKNDAIDAVYFKNVKNNSVKIIKAKIFIDATELGDVLKAAGVPYNTGMESGALTGENVGVNETNNIIQDLTYVATLKDFGAEADKTIPRPANYNPKEFDGSNTNYYFDKNIKAPTVSAKAMLEYGKLPNRKYMINWPIRGNDTYLNVIEMNETQREQELEQAKQTTLRFIYFIQHELGFKNLGLADDEFPTKDKLALIPYHREGRRAKGLVRFTMPYIEKPFEKEPLYRTGISVGDYPIDHHHKKNLAAPQHLDFHPVPSFNVPVGVMIPQTIKNLVIAEKGISVSNVVNGTTRLQPCVLLTGQAAGMLAAMSAQKNLAPQEIDIRTLQQNLLNVKAYLMPYIDVTPANPHFEAIQKIGATGILRGTGIPYKWANQTWFYPDSLIETSVFIKDVNEFEKLNSSFIRSIPQGKLKIRDAYNIIKEMKKNISVENVEAAWANWGLQNFDENRYIMRYELAVMLNKLVDPFSKKIDYNGIFLQ
jgi:hypothetical protein